MLFDGEIVLDKLEEFIIEAASKPYVSIGAFENGEVVKHHFTGAIDELECGKTSTTCGQHTACACTAECMV